jgi:tripartite-type tricarboxylate transporter receptor subunit TctC
MTNVKPAILPRTVRGIRRRSLLQGAGAALVAPGIAFAQPDDYPSRTITIVVPFPPGGQADALTRLVAQDMTATLGRSVIVDNKGGGGGAVGTSFVANAKPDGYTLAYSSSGTMVVLPATSSNLGYDPEKMRPIGQMFEIPLMVVSRKDLGANTLADLVAYAKRQGTRSVTIGNTGVGGLAHLVAEYFRTAIGIDALHVAYRGDGPMTTGLLGGEIDLGVVSVLAGTPHVKAGNLKAIAMLGAERAATLPDVPTVAESGHRGFAAGTFGGLHAPPGTPAAVIEKVSAAMITALRKPEIRDRITAQAVVPVGSRAEDYVQRIAAERQLWRGVIKQLNIKLD